MARERLSSWALYAEPVIGILAVAVAMSTFVAVGTIADTAPNDFTVFLESARWLRQGADLYQPPLRPGPGYNLNPPAAVLLFVPFSFLPDWLALYLWTALAMRGLRARRVLDRARGDARADGQHCGRALPLATRDHVAAPRASRRRDDAAHHRGVDRGPARPAAPRRRAARHRDRRQAVPHLLRGLRPMAAIAAARVRAGRGPRRDGGAWRDGGGRRRISVVARRHRPDHLGRARRERVAARAPDANALHHARDPPRHASRRPA